ncbi:TeaA receptor TeaR [Ophiocordyceps camponoti-floridani]|uniref:TeaA receptor TeaR n=1 Tax=Ophiocordyceps camponoti-floridani TaxID=2030778 RepID=A0A8H4QA20_9HYPO|nr:TeaA receptor TeaR [Ophiocordyceps camponoti-floridani]
MATTLSPAATAASTLTTNEDEPPSWAYQLESAIDDPPRLSHNQPHHIAQRRSSADNLTTALTSPSWSNNSDNDDRKQPKPRDPNESKWIHRDKLAKIESEELQAAGIFVPHSRLLPKQRRDGRNAPEVLSKSSTASESDETLRSGGWDLRNPAEVAQESTTNAYFVPAKGGSRIPVAKLSHAPIPLDCLERGSQAVRRQVDGEGDGLSYSKPRSRSASLSVSEAINQSGVPSVARRSITDTSPRKNAPRKLSAVSKPIPAAASRPKTRSVSGKDAARTSTRAGEPSAAGWAPEGDPPWMANTYKPDPRLPPDQQLLPTVARRLQQEKWEKEGKFGDAYDREFRPLNVHELPKPAATAPKPSLHSHVDQEEGEPPKATSSKLHPLSQCPSAEQQAADEWPLRQGKTLNTRQGSYSTMPKITDSVPLTSPPRPPVAQAPTLAAPETTNTAQMADPSGDDEKRKAGCGCCIVM